MNDKDEPPLEYPSMNGATFPMILHEILSNDSLQSIISWVGNGQSWQVLDPKKFEEEVLSQYFRHRSLPSFMRQVNNWDFQRIKLGLRRSAYHHKVRLCSSLSKINI